MGLMSGKNARVYIAGYDISGKSNKWTLPMSRAYKDVTCMGLDGHKWYPLLYSDAFNFDAFYDSDADGVRVCLENLRGNTSAIICFLLGTTLGDEAVGGYGAFQENFNISMPITDMLTLASVFKFEEKADEGAVLLFPKATKTSDGSHTVLDQSSASADGAVAYLQVFSCGGDDALIVKVQHSDDNFVGDVNDLITFTTANGVTSERKTVSGAVKRYVRVNWAGTPTYSASFAVIFKRL